MGGRRANQTGRPVTVQGTANLHVRLSPELLAKVRATTEAQHVSMSEAVRLVLELVVDSPGDVLASMAADPEAKATVFVERVPAGRRAAAG